MKVSPGPGRAVHGLHGFGMDGGRGTAGLRESVKNRGMKGISGKAEVCAPRGGKRAAGVVGSGDGGLSTLQG